MVDTHCYSTVKYLAFLRKRMNTNPSRGPYHFRAPSKIFWRTVRGETLTTLNLQSRTNSHLRAFKEGKNYYSVVYFFLNHSNPKKHTEAHTWFNTFSLTWQWWTLYPEADPFDEITYMDPIAESVGALRAHVNEHLIQLRRWPFEFRCMKMYFVLTGMLPHKTKRGQAALERLKVFDGIPPPYDKVIRVKHVEPTLSVAFMASSMMLTISLTCLVWV